MTRHEKSKTGCVANFPNGSRLDLQGRDPKRADVWRDLIKAAAVSAEFGLVLECSLNEAVSLYELILSTAEKNRAHQLMERARLLHRSMRLETNNVEKRDTPGRSGKTIH